MTTFETIVMIIGFGLVLLGSASGYILFRRATSNLSSGGDGTEPITLWGLFVGGLSSGLIMLWLVLPK